MVASASKILTVSYGTFSCTLEGFDEPFIMMKAVAEYFRDLAADDRYFGAEPPQPDGEALQRLANREIRQRVEARVEGAGVTLRASAPDAAPVAAVAPAVATPRVATPPEPRVNHEVAAKLERIRRAVAEARASVAQDTVAIIEDAPEIIAAPVPDETTDLLLNLPTQTVTAPVPDAGTDPVDLSPSEQVDAEPVAAEETTQAPIAADADAADAAVISDTAISQPPAPQDIVPKDPPLLLLGPVLPAADSLPDDAETVDVAFPDIVPVEADEADAGTAVDSAAVTAEGDINVEASADLLQTVPDTPASDILTADELPQNIAVEASVVPRSTEIDTDTALPPTDTLPGPEAQEDNLRRLFDTTEEQLAGNESQRRISAIAQLKAAVAATIAERLAIGRRKAAAPEPTPVPGASPHEAPAPGAELGDRTPPPLVLISAQRVEPQDPTPMPMAPPHRIQVAQPETSPAPSQNQITEPCDPATAQNFARFARSYGSHGLDDLLEAAAAYTAQVEGHSHFSPPEIMHKLSAVAAEGEFTPEERLRVFGRLLRQGKIAKIKPGQYTITEASRFYQKRA